MKNGEDIRDYRMRAEQLQMELEEVSENLSERMLKSMITKGLPREFEQFLTVLNFSKEEKTIDELKKRYDKLLEREKRD